MELTNSQHQAIMTCRELHQMNWSQIADKLLIPPELVMSGYKAACSLGMAAKRPNNRMRRVDKTATKRVKKHNNSWARCSKADHKDLYRKQALAKKRL